MKKAALRSTVYVHLDSGLHSAINDKRQLPPTVVRAERTISGKVESVVLKLVQRDEWEIHRFLSDILSRCNHTIPILDHLDLRLGMERIIAMPQEMMLRDVPNSVFETNGNDLAGQFFEGVEFMHQHLVAHLDLKPDNVVVTADTRARIIDLGVSVRVSQPEEWIEGYRGTEGWAAPEVEKGKYQPIRADLWSMGRMAEYFADRQGADSESPLKSVANRLLNHEPLRRSFLYRANQPLKSKRKRDVGAQEKEEVKRKCVQPGTHTVPQDTAQHSEFNTCYGTPIWT